MAAVTDIVEIHDLLDPEVAAVLAALTDDNGELFEALSDETLDRLRAVMANIPMPELSDQVMRTDHPVPGTDGVIVRVHRPVGEVAGALPCVYWMHGGGMIIGS